MVLSIFNVLERIGVRWGKLSSILLTVSQGICRGGGGGVNLIFVTILVWVVNHVLKLAIHHSTNTGAYEYSLKHYKSFGGQRDVFYHRYSIRILRVV